MKGRNYTDLGTIFDEIFDAARDFRDEFQQNFNDYGSGFVNDDFGRRSPFGQFRKNFFDENTDFYPNYSYPPMNVCMTNNRTLIFEFALAGFDEKDISLSFQGDYMVFSAKIVPNAEEEMPEENLRYLKRRLKMKDIEKQKYYVPLDKYAQEQVKAVFRNGILKVTIPPKDDPAQNDGIKIEIIKEGD